MVDYNFFKPYMDSNKNSNIKTTTIIGGALTGILVVGCFSFNVVESYLIKKNIYKLENAINDSDFQNEYDEYKEISYKHDILNEYNKKLDIIFNKVNNRVKLTPDLIKKINSTVPNRVFFENLILENGGDITINCKANSRGQIADFEHNLKELDFIKECHVTNITSESEGNEENFSFSINCKLKEGYYDQIN